MRRKAVGAVLIMTMMAVCLTFMMLFVLIQTSGIGLHNTMGFHDREAALLAAQSGLDYAVTRLQHNNGWRGDSNCKYWNGSDVAEKTYGSADKLLVGESNGNVVGLIHGQSGNVSVFRVKFHYEDNSAATYDLVERSRFGERGKNDYLPKYKIRSPYVSVNNMLGVVKVPVRRAKQSGEGVAAKTDKLEYSDETEPDASIACMLDPQRVYLVVEGIAGSGLRDCKDLADANDIANKAENVSFRYIEACYTSIAPILKGDAAFANGKVDFKVKDKLLASTAARRATSFTSDVSVHDFGNVPAAGSLRSNTGDITVSGGKLNTFNGRLIFPKEAHASFNKDEDEYIFIDSTGKSKKFKFDKNEPDHALTEIEPLAWKDVGKAENVNANKLTAGFYQWQLTPSGSDSASQYSLLYYPGGYKLESGRPVPINANNFKIAVPGNVAEGETVKYGNKTVKKVSIGPADKISVETDENGRPTLKLQGKLYCAGAFAVGSDVSQVFPKCPQVKILPLSNGERSENGILTVGGNAYVASSLVGSGSVVSQNDITLMGESLLDSGDGGVAVYGNNITLKSLDLMPVANSELTADVSNVNKDTMSFGSEFYEMLDASWHSHPNAFTNSSGKKITCPDPQDVTAYLQLTLGINGRCPSMWSDNPEFEGETTRVYRFPIELIDKNTGSVVANYYFDCHSTGILINNSGHSSVSGTVNLIGSEINIPPCVRLPNYNSKPKVMKEHVELFGSLCYGDQVFNGILYAKSKFTADLSDKFHLTVNGAVKVENGDLDVTCKGADLSYDETYMRLLMPGYCKLNCVMWNCW